MEVLSGLLDKLFWKSSTGIVDDLLKVQSHKYVYAGKIEYSFRGLKRWKDLVFNIADSDTNE